MKTISPKKLHELKNANSNITLIDVRTPVEFRSVHVGFAENLPLDEIDKDSASKVAENKDEVYLICKSGARSAKAYEKFASYGYQNIISVDGGTEAWSDSNYPVIEGKKSISIERQVRIAAGGLVVVGIALSFAVHISFIGISAFVGAGLMFAGITDT